MKEKRESVLFKPYTVTFDKTIACAPPRLYPQETDWTCSLGCIRTMLSALDENVMEEKAFVEKFKMKPQPYYSKDIKALSILDGYDAIYGCDSTDTNLDKILNYCAEGYYVMVESMINYSHWLVLMGYYTVQEYGDVEKSKLLFFDPYYNEIKMIRVDEFLSMWIDGNYAETKVAKDFIAIKNR